MNRTQIEELKIHAQERDFLCVVRDAFRAFARRSSIVLGTPWAFAFAILVIAVWAATGPKFHYSDTWQLIINTGTTIVTFLMVFVIQNTQNRDGKAIQLKLDELIRALKGARNKLVDLEDLSDEELKNSKRNSSGCTSNLEKPTRTSRRPTRNAEFVAQIFASAGCALATTGESFGSSNHVKNLASGTVWPTSVIMAQEQFCEHPYAPARFLYNCLIHEYVLELSRIISWAQS